MKSAKVAEKTTIQIANFKLAPDESLLRLVDAYQSASQFFERTLQDLSLLGDVLDLFEKSIKRGFKVSRIQRKGLTAFTATNVPLRLYCQLPDGFDDIVVALDTRNLEPLLKDKRFQQIIGSCASEKMKRASRLVSGRVP